MDPRIATALATIDADAATVAALYGTPAVDPSVPLHLVPALEALTALAGETREAHLGRICADPTARLVALAQNTLAVIEGADRTRNELVVTPERKQILSSMDICGSALAALDAALIAA